MLAILSLLVISPSPTSNKQKQPPNHLWTLKPNKQMAITLSVRPNRAIFCRDSPHFRRPNSPARRLKNTHLDKLFDNRATALSLRHRSVLGVLLASSRADDSAPSEMSVESALKLLGVDEGASFDDILRAKKSILAGCKDDDQDSIAQV